MNKVLQSTLLLLIVLFTKELHAQNSPIWQATSLENTERLIPVKKQKDFKLNIDEIKSQLKHSSEFDLNIPYPNGQFQNFTLTERPIMAPGLAAKYPNIKAFVGRNPKTGESIRISVGADGFHAMIFSKEGLFFIDPISKLSNTPYQVYYKKDINTELINRNFTEGEPIIADQQKFAVAKRRVESGLVERPSGTELRTYRLAVATTGEYTQFHGGTVEGALSAIVTTMNRVNGIYERDIAVTMVLVENNDELIYTDASTDPYTNNSASSFIDEVQDDITNIIGSDNFDIGHGFSTGAGGLASLGSVCVDSRKASGVTGRQQPIGDPYDVDYVAHEIGHQFGAPHTFNGTVGSCAGGNRSANSAYEPGSGTTIMAYAGICGSDNIQNNSDPYFHTASLDFMTVFSQDNAGNSCAEITQTANNLPIVDAGEGGYTIPFNTPFQLNGSATDPDGDGLTYTWEQFDLGPAGSPNDPADNAPLFRSFEPTTDSFRIFPQLSDILNGIQTQGEILPTYARDLNFRLTVRDDQTIAGVDYDAIGFSVTDQAGPFTVDEFTGSYTGLSSVTVNWQVNNTDIAPISAELVDIYISDDGGLTFTELVIANTPNDGSQVVSLPNINTSTAKFKIAASNNVFFNISPGTFTISESEDPSFTIALSSDNDQFCPTDEITFTVESESILGFNDPIQLAIDEISGFTAVFDNPTINPGETTTLRLTNVNEASGNYNLTVNATAAGTNKTSETPFSISNNPVAPTIIAPADASTDLSLNPVIEWEDSNLAATYTIEVASEANFLNILETGSTSEKEYTIQNELEGNSTYFVRINAANNCGQSESVSISFTTAAISCLEQAAVDLPITIESQNRNLIISNIFIENSGELENLTVTNISGTHSYISDLVFTLVSPEGTEVVLLSNVCTNEDNFEFSISDDAESSTLPCPPTDGGTYQPESPLNLFLGENIQGEWTLYVEDQFSQDGGELQSWGLTLCVSNEVEPAILRPTNLTAVENDQGEVLLNWSDNANNETGFRIERSPDGVNYEMVAEVEMNNTSYSDTSYNPDAIYIYRVKAFNETEESLYSNLVEIVTMISYPNPPSNLVANLDESTISLNWEDNATNETGYLIERSMNSEAFEEIASLDRNIEEYQETLEPGTYSYRVAAINERGNSDYSNEVSVEIIAFPETPSNLQISVIDFVDARLSWEDNANNELGYIIERAVNAGSFEEIAVTDIDIEAFEETLDPGIYTYRVLATNERGESDYSNEVSVNIIDFPRAPTNLEVQVVDDYTAELTWNDNASNEASYVVERSTASGDFEVISELAANTQFFEEELDINEYKYRVAAKNIRGYSEYSNEVAVGSSILNTNIELLKTIEVFPNPAAETIYILNESNIQFEKVEVRNTLGQLVHSESIIISQQALELDVQNLGKGLYLIHIVTDTGSIVKQIIVE